MSHNKSRVGVESWSRTKKQGHRIPDVDDDWQVDSPCFAARLGHHHHHLLVRLLLGKIRT